MDDIEYIKNLNIKKQEKEELLTRFINLQKITESKEIDYLEMEREISENIISSIFNHSKDFIHIVDLNGYILKTNQAAINGLGFSREEIEGKHITDFINQKYLPNFAKSFPELKKTGHVQAEIEVIHKSGRIISVDGRASALFDKNGNITSIIVFRRNISEQKQFIKELQESREKIRESEELFKVFMDTLPAAAFIKDSESKSIFLNKYMTDKLVPTNWLNKIPADLYPRDVAEKLRIDDLKAMKEGIIISEDRVQDKEGLERIFQTIKFQILRPDKPVLLGGIALDITETKKLEEQLMNIQKLESLGILAGGIAHDFNNILTSIMGNLSLIKFDLQPESELYTSINEIEKSTFRAKDLTNQLLTFSKGGAPLKKAADIREIIQESANFILRGSKVKSVFDFASDLFPVEVDKGQINQVLNNILINADQAMPLGGYLEISVSNKSILVNNILSLSAGDYIEIVIADQGVGIPPEYQSKIFMPYFTTKQKGSGLGLATSFSIIKRHGGTIMFASTLGEGTTFSIYIPANKNRTSMKVAAKKTISNQKLNLKILVMDDEPTVLHISEKMLKKLNCSPYLTHSGHEALAIFGEEYAAGRPFDCLLLDLTIPGGAGGRETLKKIREIDPNVVAVVSSGYSTDPIMANHEDYGFNWAIPKPYTMSALQHLLENIYHYKQDKK